MTNKLSAIEFPVTSIQYEHLAAFGITWICRFQNGWWTDHEVYYRSFATNQSCTEKNVGGKTQSDCDWCLCWLVCLRRLCHHILSVASCRFRESWFLSPLLCNLWRVHIIGYIMAWRRYLFVCILHYHADLSGGINRVRYIYSVACVSKIKSILSMIFYVVYVPSVFILPISLSIILRIFVLHFIIIIKFEIWIISHCLRFGHETMVSTTYVLLCS